MENWGKVQIITKISGKIGGKIGEKIGGKIITKIGGKTCGKICGKIITNIGEKIITKIGGNSRWKISEKALKNLWKNWWKNRWKKGRVQKKSLELVWSLTKPGGRGVSKGRQKSKTQVCKCIFSVSMQNHSRTPKTCFTLGLECLCHIYSH